MPVSYPTDAGSPDRQSHASRRRPGADRTRCRRAWPAGDVEQALTERAGHAVELAACRVPTWWWRWAATAPPTRSSTASPTASPWACCPPARPRSSPASSASRDAVADAARGWRPRSPPDRCADRARRARRPAVHLLRGLGLDAEVTRRVDEQRALRRDGRRPGDLRGARCTRARSPGRRVVAARTDVGDRPAAGWCAAPTWPSPTSTPTRTSARSACGRRLAPASTRRSTPPSPARCARATCGGCGVYGLMWPRHAIGRDRRVTYLHDRAQLVVLGDEPVPVQIDGEYLGRVTSADIRYEPDAISVYVPPAETGPRARPRQGQRQVADAGPATAGLEERHQVVDLLGQARARPRCPSPVRGRR